jgi:hypothetical protein
MLNLEIMRAKIKQHTQYIMYVHAHSKKSKGDQVASKETAEKDV